MKISFLKEFGSSPANNTLSAVIQYLSREMVQNLSEIGQVLRKLTFGDNFESFEFTGTIPANTELAIQNTFRNGVVPSKRLIVRGDTYSHAVVDGDTLWDKNYVYLKNTVAHDCAVTVIFLK